MTIITRQLLNKVTVIKVLCNRRGRNVGGLPGGNVGVHHMCTIWSFVQLSGVEITVNKQRRSTELHSGVDP